MPDDLFVDGDDEVTEETAAEIHRQAKLDQLVEDYLNIHADEEKVKTRKRELADELIAELGIGGRHEIRPGLGIRVQRPASQFKADLAQTVLTAEQLAAISEPRPSSELARELLPPVLYKQLTRPNSRPSIQPL